MVQVTNACKILQKHQALHPCWGAPGPLDHRGRGSQYKCHFLHGALLDRGLPDPSRCLCQNPSSSVPLGSVLLQQHGHLQASLGGLHSDPCFCCPLHSTCPSQGRSLRGLSIKLCAISWRAGKLSPLNGLCSHTIVLL